MRFGVLRKISAPQDKLVVAAQKGKDEPEKDAQDADNDGKLYDKPGAAQKVLHDFGRECFADDFDHDAASPVLAGLSVLWMSRFFRRSS